MKPMTTRMGRTRVTVLAAAVAAALTLGLAGCSGDDEGDGDGDPTEAVETPSETATPNTTSPPDLPKSPKLRNADGALADVEWDAAGCPTGVGEQRVEGTVTNPGNGSADYVIAVSWTNATSDVLGKGVAVVEDAETDESTDWELTGEVTEGAVMCVINVMRGELAKKNQG